jgi:hypothetical protein
MAVRSDLYAALFEIGIEPDEAARIAAAERADLEAAIIAVAHRLGEVLRALDKLENDAAKSLGMTRTKRFAPP